jgi:DNA-directed RNA polymerase sigma subunit (sigma70/sigma32)
MDNKQLLGLVVRLAQAAGMAPDVLTSFASSDLHESLNNALNTLGFRQREMLKLLYGLNGGDCYTVEECAGVFKTSVDNVLKNHTNALTNLQRLSHGRGPGRGLKGFLPGSTD